MGQTAGARGIRYLAFISYNHRDQAFGRRLHRRLEAYRLPKRLTAPGGVARLSPVFRDRDELPAAKDLTAQVRAALEASAALIVVCSPSARASHWVAREIEVFRELHPERPILAALAKGEPADAFPAALGDCAREPLAADFRKGRDGQRLALLKLVAGVLGLGLDELVQRDAQRRVRRVTAVTVAACAMMLALSASTVVALRARAEAERQRVEAEGLVEFMLTDLRTRLQGVGRLDVMSAVNARALSYYRDQDLGRLPSSSLERRARLLQAIGEDDLTRGDTPAALGQFQEAERTTAALLRETPDDPERIFDHAQSEFWLGDANAVLKRPDKARAFYQAYKRLTDRLAAIQPANPRFQREAGYADGDLCALDLQPPLHAAAAVRECRSGLDHMQAAAKRLPGDGGVERDLVNRHAWLADAYRAAGDYDGARRNRAAEEALLTREIAARPLDTRLKYHRAVLHYAQAQIERDAGHAAKAAELIRKAEHEIDELVALDPSNQEWAQEKILIVSYAQSNQLTS